MAHYPGGLELSSVPEIMAPAAIGEPREELSRAVFAVNDAGNLTDALAANLEWLSQALTSRAANDEVRPLMCEAVDVCIQLTRLLGGAIGSCRSVTRTVSPSLSATPLARLVAIAVSKISRLADSAGVLLLSEGPEDLLVSVDPELMNTALETLLIRAVHSSPAQGVVRIHFDRCGGHAVIALNSEGAGLSRIQLEQLYSSSCVANAEGVASSLTSEALRVISTMLFEQGGYLDAEERPEGGATLFIVVPASDDAIEEPVKSGTVLAVRGGSSLRQDSVAEQKRSEKMIVHSDRFGAIEVDATDTLSFPTGIVGFPKENEFVLVRKTDSQIVGWLQSTKSSYLTLPVVSAHVLGPRFPDVPIESYAERAGLGTNPEELAVLAVLSAPPGQPATVNLMAPIIVNATTRQGAQVLIEGTRFTTRELFIVQATPNLDLEHSATAMPDEPQSATSAAE